MDTWIDPVTRRAFGDPGPGGIYFQSICAGCHGADGMAVTAIPPLGDFSREEPWHALHVILNGHPNGSMPPLRVLNHARLADTLAYMQTLPSRPAIAAIVHGGRLYDTWYTENGGLVPEGWHPAYPEAARSTLAGETEASLTRAQRFSWRCVACHGWDYKGAAGVTRGQHAQAPHRGIDGMVGMFPKHVESILVDETHHYERLLSVRDIQDLAMFVSRGQIDMATWIDPQTGRFRGDEAVYEASYQTICATCHGADGRAVRTMPPLGRMVTGDPERSLHSVFNGHAGDDMPPLRAMGADVAAGILAYAATLPIRK
nr:cytochrome c [Roseospira visakhapatnamensis]